MANRFWNPAIDANWNSANSWSLTDGGTPNQATPTLVDDVFFSNANSKKCTISANAVCANINFNYGTGYTGTFTGVYNLTVYNSSVEFSSLMTCSSQGYLIFHSGGSYTLKSNSCVINSTVELGTSSDLTLLDNLETTNGFTLDPTSTFNSGNFNITAYSFYSDILTTINMGSGIWTLTGNGGDSWNVESNVTINCNTSTIKIINTVGYEQNFVGSDKNYYNLWFTGDSGALNILVGSNTFNNLKLDAGTNIYFENTSTQTITTFTAIGDVGNLITLNTLDYEIIGEQFILSKSSGTVNCDYLNISNCNATGGATWLAGNNSVNTTNNNGWIFTNIVPVLDKEQIIYNLGIRVYSARSLCQTFTSGITGKLTSIDMNFFTLSYTNYPLQNTYPATISILGTTGVDNTPDSSNVLWTHYYNSLSSGWFNVDMTDSPPNIIAGNLYGIRIECADSVTGDPDDTWSTDTTHNYYSGGKLWENRGSGWVTITISSTPYPDADATFRTYVSGISNSINFFDFF